MKLNKPKKTDYKPTTESEFSIESYRGDYFRDRIDIDTLKGKTFKEIFQKEIDGVDTLVFISTDNEIYLMYHEQDCCENVYLEDICGDLEDLLNTPILWASCVSNRSDPPLTEDPESYTWTFYKIDSANGGITIRWYGSSNGYYSESAGLYQLIKEFK